MTIYALYTIFLLVILFGLLLGIQSLIEWRRADIEDYQRRFLNKKPKHKYDNAEKEKEEHD